MITGVLPGTRKLVDTARGQPFTQGRAEQEMIDTKAGVARERLPEILPEGINPLVRMQQAESVRSSHGDQLGIGGPHLRIEQGIIAPPLRGVDIQVSRHDVEVADKSHRHLQLPGNKPLINDSCSVRCSAVD